MSAFLLPKDNANYLGHTLRAESPSIFLEKSGKGRRLLPLPDFSRNIEGDSAHRVPWAA